MRYGKLRENVARIQYRVSSSPFFASGDSETARPVQAAAPDSLPTSSSAPAPAAPSPTSALGSLCAYGDMSSDDNDEDKEGLWNGV